MSAVPLLTSAECWEVVVPPPACFSSVGAQWMEHTQIIVTKASSSNMKSTTPSVSSRIWGPIPECQGLPAPFPLELQMACHRNIFVLKVISLLAVSFSICRFWLQHLWQNIKEQEAYWSFRRERGRWQDTRVAVGHRIFEEFSDFDGLNDEFEMALNLGWATAGWFSTWEKGGNFWADSRWECILLPKVKNTSCEQDKGQFQNH